MKYQEPNMKIIVSMLEDVITLSVGDDTNDDIIPMNDDDNFAQ